MSILRNDILRAARGLTGWSVSELAERSGVSASTISGFESGDTPRKSPGLSARITQKIVATFAIAGVEISSKGVTKQDMVTYLEGPDVNDHILDDVYSSLQDKGGEVLIAGLSEVSPDSDHYPFVKNHVGRLISAGITERILIEEGDTNLLGPSDWYRWLPKGKFNNSPFQLYGNKIALKNWGPPQSVVLVNNVELAKTFRNMFDVIWDQAQPVKREDT